MTYTLEPSARVGAQCDTHTHTHTAEVQGSLQGSCGRGLASRRDGLRGPSETVSVALSWGGRVCSLEFANGG